MQFIKSNLVTNVTQNKKNGHGEQGTDYICSVILRRILSPRDSFGTKGEGFAQDGHLFYAAPNHFTKKFIYA